MFCRSADVTIQVDKAEGFYGLDFLRNEDSSLLEPKGVETGKVLNGLACVLRDPL